MHLPVRIKLSVMMFLQFAIWGSWFVTTSTYLQAVGFDGLQIGAAYSTMNWGAIIAPIVAGAFADRFFQAQKVMGVLHLVGAALLWWISSITEPGAFFWALLAYAICYMPTLGPRQCHLVPPDARSRRRSSPASVSWARWAGSRWALRWARPRRTSSDNPSSPPTCR